ncbi:MAG: hypothetical protein ABI723_01470 [Bacteroidia bacterium]
MAVFLFAITQIAKAGNDDDNPKGFRRFHFTVQAGFNKTNIDEVISKTFASEAYQGTKSLLDDYLKIGGSPENASGINPVINLSFDVSVNNRFKLGIGVNGIPESHVIGYVNKDSLVTNPDYAFQLYDKVDEIVRGTTFKLQAIYALKPYHGNIGIGWELDFGAGLTCNFVNVKQNYLIQSVDSTTQEIITGYYSTTDKKSSVGAYLLGRLDVHLTRGFSVTGDFNWMFDTGVKINETHFNYYDTKRQIDSHRLNFNSYLIAVGVAWHF